MLYSRIFEPAPALRKDPAPTITTTMIEKMGEALEEKIEADQILIAVKKWINRAKN